MNRRRKLLIDSSCGGKVHQSNDKMDDRVIIFSISPDQPVI